MKSKRAVLSLVIFSAFNLGANAAQRGPQGGPPGIPAQAYTACVGKAVGDSVSDGRMTGTCQTAPNGQLALRPEGGPPGGEPPSSSN